MIDKFDLAARDLSTAFESRTSYCTPFLDALPVTGAAISTIGLLLAPETVCASDAGAAHLDELQFDLGEGPSWAALATRRPVLEPDVRSPTHPEWPAFSNAVQETLVRAVFAFPLTIGSLDVGVIDMYSLTPGTLDDSNTRGACRLAEVAARQVLREVLVGLTADPDIDSDDTAFSRRIIHQATGMVLAQLDISATDAVLVLRGHAFATGRSVREIAEDVVEWRLDFSPNESKDRSDGR